MAAEVQRTLHLSKKEFEEFIDQRGQVFGTMEEIAKMARQSDQAARRMGMSVAQVNQMMTGFRQQGMEMGTGQAATGQALMGMAEQIAGLQMAGGITRDELFRYGGRTTQEAVQRQVQVRMQQNLQTWQRGGLGGLGILAQNPQMLGRFMAGGMGFLGAQGAAGGMMAADPLTQLRAQYDPQQYRQMAVLGGRMAYQRAQDAMRAGMFGMFASPADQQLMAMDMFRRSTGLNPLEARQRYMQFERERDIFRVKADDLDFKNPQAHGQKMQHLYQKLMAGNMLNAAMRMTGASTPMEATARLYRDMTNKGENPIDLNKPTEDLLQEAVSSGPLGERWVRARGGEAVKLLGEAGEFGRGLETRLRESKRSDVWRTEQSAQGWSETRLEREIFEAGAGLISQGWLRSEGWYGKMMSSLGGSLAALEKAGMGRRSARQFLLGRPGAYAEIARNIGTPEETMERLYLNEYGEFARKEDGKLVAMNRESMLKRYGHAAVGEMMRRVGSRLSRISSDPNKALAEWMRTGARTQAGEALADMPAERVLEAIEGMVPGGTLRGGPELGGDATMRSENVRSRAAWIAGMVSVSDEAGAIPEAIKGLWSDAERQNFERIRMTMMRDPTMARFAKLTTAAAGGAGGYMPGISYKAGLRWTGIATSERESAIKELLGGMKGEAFQEKMASLLRAGKVGIFGVKPEEWTAEKFAEFQKDGRMQEYFGTLTDQTGFLQALHDDLAKKASESTHLQRGHTPDNPLYVKDAGKFADADLANWKAATGGT
jgi:hypothetical protein